MENKPFSINGFFNNLPIRIIGSPEEPFFYASDIADILGVGAVSVKNFDETEIVTPEMRKKYDIKTYRKYKEKFRRDDSVILITEFGVYRLFITHSKSEMAREFKKYIYQLIKDTRNKENEKLVITNQNDIDKMNKNLQQLKKIHNEYQKYNPAIYVFTKEINDIPYKYMLKSDVDEYIAGYDNEKCKKLYKFTTEPNVNDYTNFTLEAKIFGDSEQIMNELVAESLSTNPKIMNYCVYHADIDLDLLDFKIIYQ